jgi:hypothetical protein
MAVRRAAYHVELARVRQAPSQGATRQPRGRVRGLRPTTLVRPIRSCQDRPIEDHETVVSEGPTAEATTAPPSGAPAMSERRVLARTLAAGSSDPAVALRLQRAAGNRATTAYLQRSRSRRVLARQSLISGVAVKDMPDENGGRKIEVNGTTVMTVDLPQGGSITLQFDYEPTTGSGGSVLRIWVTVPKGALALVRKSTYKDALDSAASRWSLRVDQPSDAVPEGAPPAVRSQEITSEPPPPPKAVWTPKEPHRPKPTTPTAPEAPPPSKVDTVLQHLNEGRWDTDDLAAELSVTDMTTLTPEQRVALIADVGSGLVVGDEDEETVDRLLESTPTSDYAEVARLMLARKDLLQTLDNAIDGEEYKRYITALTNLLMSAREPRELYEAIQTAPVLHWTGGGVHIGRAVYEATWTEGKIHLRRWYGAGPMAMEAPPLDLSADEMVVVYFDYDEPDADAKAGEYRPMPAASFMSLVNLHFKREAWLAVNVALLVSGVGGVAGAATRVARFLAALDLAISAAAIGIDMYRAQISATENGKAFLKAWDTVQMLIGIYGIGRLLMHAPQAIRNARALWNKARPSVLEKGAVTAANETEKHIVKVERSLDDAEREARAAADAPAGAPHGAAAADAPPHGAGAADGPVSGPVPVAPPRKLTVMHGTDDASFRKMGGLHEGKLDVKASSGADQDFSQGLYLTTDPDTALEYAARRTAQRNKAPNLTGHPSKVVAYDIELEQLGKVVDIRPGGNYHADWEKFLDEPPFKLPPGLDVQPALASRRAYIPSAIGANRRGLEFEEFLKRIGQKDADVIVGPLGDAVFPGIQGARPSTQICLRTQAAADKLNAAMRSKP